jgi:heat-inducible transcriptional repressor
VDYLLAEMKLVEAEKENIAREYRLRMRQLEETLERTSELISAVTHSAGIVSFLEWQDRFFYKGISHILEQPEFRDLKRLRSLIKTLEEKQQLLDIINREFDEKVKVYIGTELGLEEMEGCSLVVSSYRRRNKPSGRLAVLGPMRMEYRHIIPTLEYVSAALTEALETI